MTNLNINCPNIRDIPYNQIPLQKVGDYWGFDTRSVTVQYTETIAVFKMSSEVIKCPTIGAASFSQSPYIARYLPVRGIVGHNIDKRITGRTRRNTGHLPGRPPMSVIGRTLRRKGRPPMPVIGRTLRRKGRPPVLVIGRTLR